MFTRFCDLSKVVSLNFCEDVLHNIKIALKLLSDDKNKQKKVPHGGGDRNCQNLGKVILTTAIAALIPPPFLPRKKKPRQPRRRPPTTYYYCNAACTTPREPFLLTIDIFKRVFYDFPLIWGSLSSQTKIESCQSMLKVLVFRWLRHVPTTWHLYRGT